MTDPFTVLNKQIAAWNTFVSSDDKKIDHDEAMLSPIRHHKSIYVTYTNLLSWNNCAITT